MITPLNIIIFEIFGKRSNDGAECREKRIYVSGIKKNDYNELQVKIERGSLVLFYLLVIITPQSTSIWSTKTYKIEKKKKMESDFWSYFLFRDFGLWVFYFRRLAKISFWAWNRTPTGNHFPACFSRFLWDLFQEDLTVSSLLWEALCLLLV